MKGKLLIIEKLTLDGYTWSIIIRDDLYINNDATFPTINHTRRNATQWAKKFGVKIVKEDWAVD
jgi:hypothetical protein